MPRNKGTSRKGKPKKNERAAGMGRALQRAQPHKHKSAPSLGGMAKTAGVDSINIEKEDNRMSVLEMNDLDDFLTQAEMLQKEFAVEREQMVILDETAQYAAPMEEEKTSTVRWDDQIASAAKDPFAFQELSVPRRPQWDESTTPEELDFREKESFLEWRRAIAMREEKIAQQGNGNGPSRLGVTPFEKNLEIWRQLWRVMERCSCIVQIVDARNPLFYLSQDLKKYATEELGKPMVLVINKSDYLSSKQRQEWHEFFSQPGQEWDHVFFSAHEQQKIIDDEAARLAEEEANDYGGISRDDEGSSDNDEQEDESYPRNDTGRHESSSSSNVGVEEPLTATELLDWLKGYALKHNCSPDQRHNRIPFGMVGFPNVGKSSVINVLMGNAKNQHGVVRVGVAAQPGKTKHFQTLLIPSREDMMLCDCPGLVFPSFVNNTADLIAAGVYPIAQMRDFWPVVSLLCHRIPREVLNAHYGIQIPLPSADTMMQVKDGKIPPPTADEFLTTYCVARSMLAASSGVPDYTRASRIVIQDYAAGRLLFCHAPPTTKDSEAFQKETLLTTIRNTKKLQEKLADTIQSGPQSSADNNDRDDDRDNSAAAEESSDVEDDDLMAEMMGLDLESTAPSNKAATKPATKKKKWGKKGRKLRNKDPYGCHSTPDDSLVDASSSTQHGLVVNAGKYGRKGYTRPTGYGHARS